MLSITGKFILVEGTDSLIRTQRKFLLSSEGILTGKPDSELNLGLTPAWPWALPDTHEYA